ncbi:hypothetical protein NE897_12000 [Yersinia ruckeri]|uniref:Microcin E492 n=2 Tax=Yersinia ruckeri TaxID=29486 RepID=A0A085UAT3_YERRU|nr:hypothetical protein [Yersinia ruckeri]AKA38376.1 hypothetical protein UGYR_08175 [Yersinia ruckeri]ARY99750.1 Microcin E492 precursor [Yersinia ruckeri]AUQ41878.1 hypothetical protein NJ56_08100 [Yersinia ruckeri]EEP99451.1 Microcin-24 [Yersinia ruckeri ATCC 29473]EKN3346060.1 hypothetical protein [Yersinia ruckeri]
MIKLNNEEMSCVYGSVDNRQVIKDILIDSVLGAGFGAPGGPPGMLLGAGLGASQSVIHSAINHGPVDVKIPTVPMGPIWNGSGVNIMKNTWVPGFGSKVNMY